MSQSPIDTEVLIVGGGIGGLTLAAILRRINISCKVLERSDVHTPVGAGISLAPNGLKVLDQLGIYDKIESVAQPLHNLNIYRNDKLWSTLNWDILKTKFGYHVMSMERHHFQRLLHEAAGGDELVEYGVKVVDVVDNPSEDAVKVILDSGKEYRAKLVVGADGIRSIVRRCLARDEGMKEANTIKFTGRVHMSGITKPLEHLNTSHLGTAHWMLYDNATLTTWPCINNQQWFIGVAKTKDAVPTDRSVWKNCDENTINDVYGDEFHPFSESGKMREIIGKNERILASNVFQEVEFPSMARGRVCLVGDAAHAMTSAFGQGGMMAIEDAATLGNLIDANRKNLDNPASFLREYSDVRGKRVEDVVKFSFRFIVLHSAALPFGIGGFLRWFAYACVPAFIWHWYLGWLYGYQPTVNALNKPADRK